MESNQVRPLQTLFSILECEKIPKMKQNKPSTLTNYEI